MPEITEPLRLARSLQHGNNGYGCAMQVIAWEQGDVTGISVTDYPRCSAPFVSAFAQGFNDTYCAHPSYERISDDDFVKVSCPKCSLEILDLAHRTVGTRGASRLLFMQAMAEVLGLVSDEKVDWDTSTYALGLRFGTNRLLGLAHKVFDRFNELSGHQDVTPDPQVTAAAVAKMKETASV